MKALAAVVLSISMALFAVAQAPLTAGPAAAGTGTSTAGAVANRHARGVAAAQKAAPPQETRATVHKSHHRLRWAIISVAVVLGVIAIIAYVHNYKGSQQITVGQP